MDRIKGIAVSPGIVVGRAFLVGTAEQVVPHRTIPESEVEGQVARLRVALEDAGRQIVELRERTRFELGEEPAKIFEFHAGLLRDRALAKRMGEAGSERARSHFSPDQFHRTFASALMLDQAIAPV